MRVGIIGTGAIAHKHAQAFLNIGVEVVACCNRSAAKGKAFAELFGCDFVPGYEDLCNRHDIDFVDVCTFPDFRLEPAEACARARKHIHLQKPLATNLDDAARIIEVSRNAGITLGVSSQQRFTDGALFLKNAIEQGYLGRLLQADAYVKWYRSSAYYEPPGKGSWALEGGGALINQGIHQVDLLAWLAGDVAEVFAYWQLGSLHAIESEDILSGLIRFKRGSTGVLQTSTAIWPGFSERVEIHGTNGTAVLTGGQISTWSVREELCPPPLLHKQSASGASDPSAIDLKPFERQMKNFVGAIESGRQPMVNGESGYKILSTVVALYESCRTGRPAQPARLES